MEKICSNERVRRRQKEADKIAAFQEWERAWKLFKEEQLPSHQAMADPEHWKVASIITDKRTSRKIITHRNTPSNIHRNLSRAQSSIAI